VKNNEEKGLRVDRWLWFTRFYKTRMLASAAVRAGHVKVNGERAKPGDRVEPGDTLDLVRDQLRFRVQVVAIPARRGSVPEARSCYEEDEAIRKQRLEMIARIKDDRRQLLLTPGRPDKHTRRMIRERRRRQTDGEG
jgi:ribosome-associated heat shock protein Hsp15